MSALEEEYSIKGYGLHDKPGSFNHLKQAWALNSQEANFLKRFSTDVYYREWKFDGKDLFDDFWTFDADATAARFYPQAAAKGLLGTTGATDAGAISMLGKKVLDPNFGAYMRVVLNLDVVTDLQYEVGLLSAVPTDPTLPIVTDIDTPATGNGDDEAALVHVDTDQTVKTLYLVGNKAGAVQPKVSIGYTPVVGDVDIRLFVDYGDITCVINNKRVFRKSIVNGLDPASATLLPWIFVRTRAVTNDISAIVKSVELLGGLS